jgi:hypothetical protein
MVLRRRRTIEISKMEKRPVADPWNASVKGKAEAKEKGTRHRNLDSGIRLDRARDLEAVGLVGRSMAIRQLGPTNQEARSDDGQLELS